MASWPTWCTMGGCRRGCDLRFLGLLRHSYGGERLESNVQFAMAKLRPAIACAQDDRGARWVVLLCASLNPQHSYRRGCQTLPYLEKRHPSGHLAIHSEVFGAYSSEPMFTENALKRFTNVVVLFAGTAGCGPDNTSASLPYNGLGRLCTTSSDCASDSICQSDKVDYIADGLCTSSCTSDSDCSARYGAPSVCLDTHVCAVACSNDSSKCPRGTVCTTRTKCLSSTVCTTYVWCQRGGPGSGVPICTGTVASCSTITREDQCGAASCGWSGNCFDAQVPCQTYSNVDDCNNHGCKWYSSDNTCSVYDACSKKTTQSSCTNPFMNCQWSAQCIGDNSYIDGCGAYTVSRCTSVLGCQVTPQ
jgi:hypothetical protein